MRWPRREEETRRLIKQANEEIKNEAAEQQAQNHQDRADVATSLHSLLVHLEAKEKQRNEREEPSWAKRGRDWLVAVAVVGAFIFAARQWSVMQNQWRAMIDSNNLTRQSLKVSQGAHVTIGRKDGVVADFVVPKDPTRNAEIVIYFQNSGHMPAKFVWGTLAPYLAAGSMKKSSGINYTHPFKGFITRTRDIKTGSIGERGESYVIAGDSVFVATLGTISQKDLADLPADKMGLLILGMFEYCDALGDVSERTFALRYRSDVPSSSLSFDLAQESAMPMLPLPSSTATTEYLPPCETSGGDDQKKAN